jgi:hypothetical protein
MNRTSSLVGVLALIGFAGPAIAADDVPWGPPLTPAQEAHFHRVGLQIEAQERRAAHPVDPAAAMHARYKLIAARLDPSCAAPGEITSACFMIADREVQKQAEFAEGIPPQYVTGDEVRDRDRMIIDQGTAQAKAEWAQTLGH